MDHCRTKQFIAFIHKNSKDRFWCNGYFAWDEYSPTLHPYDTKEQRKTAIEIGEAISAWSETSEIEAVILTVSSEIISIVNKNNKSDALSRFEKRSQDGLKKQEEQKKKLLEEKKQRKQDETEVSNEVDAGLLMPDSKVLDGDSSGQRANITTKLTTKKTETKLNENKNDVELQKRNRGSEVSPDSSSDKKDRKKLEPIKQKTEVSPVEKKRSPLEKRIPQQKEMDKKETTTPSEPKKKSGLSKIMKGK